MPEGVPTDAFGYTGSRVCRADASLHDGLGPVRLQALLMWEAQTQSSGLVESGSCGLQKTTLALPFPGSGMSPPCKPRSASSCTLHTQIDT